MGIEVGFLVSLETLGVMKKKCNRIIKATILGEREIAAVDSTVTVIDCADSQIHRFRLVESIGQTETLPEDLPIDSSLGLAIFGSRPGDYIKLNLAGEESGIVVLRVDN